MLNVLRKCLKSREELEHLSRGDQKYIFYNKVTPFAADTLFAGDRLEYGQQLVSQNGCFKATMLSNGNLGP